MFRNFITVAIRIFLRQKAYSLINITGMAIGLAGAILILLYVRDELIYDRFHQDSDRIYRAGLHATNQGNEFRLALSCMPMAPVLAEEYPEVLSTTRLFTFVGESVVNYEENSFLEGRFYYADSGFFSVFPEGLLRGDPTTVLSRANTVVITDEIARKYFGDEDPVGKLLRVGNETLGSPYSRAEYEVTGVVRKYPGNSHIKFDFLGSLVSLGTFNSTNWMSYTVHTYVKLHEGVPPDRLEARFPEMILKHVGSQWEKYVGNSMEESMRRGVIYGYFLQPIEEIHLDPDLEYEIEPGGRITSVRIFSLIAVFLIIIASINFTNLTTALSSTRTREVGIRKVAGSSRSELVFQFLTESVLLALLSLVFGLILAGYLLPYFSTLAGKELVLNPLQNKGLLPFLLVLGLTVGLMSGIYPAFILASRQPFRNLRAITVDGSGRSRLRGILVVFQFSVTIFLFICTLTVARQLNYIRHRELGYDPDDLVVIKRLEALQDQKKAFREELINFPEVIQSGFTNSLPDMLYGNTLFRPEGSSPEATHALNHWLVGYDLQRTLKMNMIEGHWFSRDFPGDSAGLVINQAAAKTLDIEDPVGKTLYYLDGSGQGDYPLKIIGLIRDFHYESVHHPIQPLVISYLPPRYSNLLVVRIRPGNYSRAIRLMRDKWKEFVPDQPFEYSILEDDLGNAYRDDLRTGTVFTVFTILAIFISLMGLIGLASYAAVLRTKEIGIRKALGARVLQVVMMLSREVILYIVLASLIAWPAAWLYMKSWLQNFAFRVGPGFPCYLLSALSALIVAMLVVGLRAYLAATANPADSLRYE